MAPTTTLNRTVSAARTVTIEARTRWEARDLPIVTLSAVTLTLLFWLAQQSILFTGSVEWLSGVRAGQSLVVSLLRIPLSIFAPAPSLPVWGALAQVLVVGAVAEYALGRRRTIGLALATQYVATMNGRVAVWLGESHLLGLPADMARIRDTGPSAAVIGVGIAAAMVLGLWRLMGIAVVCLLVEIVGLHTLAGREHLAAIALGLAIGWCWRSSRLVRTARLASWSTAAVGVALVGASMDSTPDGWWQRSALAFVPGLPAQAGRIAPIAAAACFLLLAGGLRRGHRSCWVILLGACATAIAFPSERQGAHGAAVFAVLIAFALVAGRRSFAAVVDTRTFRVAAASAALGAVAIVTIGLMPEALSDRLTPIARIAVLGAIAALSWKLTRPQGEAAAPAADALRARDIIARHGTNTLDYFALRTDKVWFFSGDSLVAYAVKGSVALVSPDPIGPAQERAQIWAAFKQHAARKGWTVSVLAVGEEWLPIYRGTGMRGVYIGDEAVVDVTSFHLEGGERKGLRQAVNRVAKKGYTVTFHESGTIDPALREGLADLIGTSRRGDAERGFSMTLGRMFDERDPQLLLAVSRDTEGRPVAFCQFVPQAGGRGWSLDVMRSEREGHPNGLLDHVIVESIKHVRDHGGTGLCLNFAAMRNVLADEPTGLRSRVKRRVVEHASESMQIESLWRFNDKFGPQWSPRYVVYSNIVDLPSAAIAIAKAEAVFELPIIGRFMRPPAAVATAC